MWFLYYGPLILFFIEIWSTDQLDYSEKYRLLSFAEFVAK
jgi:hypothetical protein